MNDRKTPVKFLTLFFLSCLGLGITSSLPASAETRTLVIEAIQVNGTKYWKMGKSEENKPPRPLEIHVKKGDTVKIEAVSLIGGENNIHGLAIDGYDNVRLLVTDKGILGKDSKPVKTFEFVADKSGKFKIFCHLHPAHVGGTFIVE